MYNKENRKDTKKDTKQWYKKDDRSKIQNKEKGFSDSAMAVFASRTLVCRKAAALCS